MNTTMDKIGIGVKLEDKYQLIRKQPPGGGGPVYIGILLERKIPVHIRFFPAQEIPDVKVFNQKLTLAKKAYELSKSFVTLPSDYGFHEGLPYAVYGISNLKTLDTFLQSGQKMSGQEKRSLIETMLKMLIQVHSGDAWHLGLSPLCIHQGKGSFTTPSIGVMDFGLTPARGHEYFTRPAADEKLRDAAAYVSPEQAEGSTAVDHRADLYSLGAVIYRIVMGRAPFGGSSPDDIIRKVTSEAPDDLSDPGLRLPEPMIQFLKRALNKDQRERFQSAADMMESFLAASKDLSGEEPARSVTSGKPAEKPAMHQPPIVIFKVSEEDAGKLEDVSSAEITAEVISGSDAITEPKPHPAPGQAERLPRKPKDKTELFIKVPLPGSPTHHEAAPMPVQEADEKAEEKKEPKAQGKGILKGFIDKTHKPAAGAAGEKKEPEKPASAPSPAGAKAAAPEEMDVPVTLDDERTSEIGVESIEIDKEDEKKHGDRKPVSPKLETKPRTLETKAGSPGKVPWPFESKPGAPEKMAPLLRIEPDKKDEKKEEKKAVQPLPAAAAAKEKVASKEKPGEKPAEKKAPPPPPAQVAEDKKAGTEEAAPKAARGEKAPPPPRAAGEAAEKAVVEREDTLNLERRKKRRLGIAVGAGVVIIVLLIVVVAIALSGNKGAANGGGKDKGKTATEAPATTPGEETQPSGEKGQEASPPATQPAEGPASPEAGQPGAPTEKPAEAEGTQAATEQEVQQEETAEEAQPVKKTEPKKKTKKATSTKSSKTKTEKKPVTKKKPKKKSNLEFVD